MPFLVAPSILSADFSCLKQEIENVQSAGADWIHVDVMDGHFVPNLTIGAPVVKSLRKSTDMPLDVHLMIEQPEKYLKDFIEAGSDFITIHVESTGNVKECLTMIRAAGVKAGITLKPKTEISEIVPYLAFVDLVLVMTVEPGFGGQTFMRDQVKKIDTLKQMISEGGFNVLIEVDGGINETTARECISADVLVAGSFVFGGDYRSAISKLKGVKP